jgi:hypothetical protein
MTRTANPIEAINEAVTPYVVTGEAEAAFRAWKEAEPVLGVIERFDELQALLSTAAESHETCFVLPAMLRLYDAGDEFACLVVMAAFAPSLYRAAVALRFEVRHSLEECARRLLFGFCSSVWYREEGLVSGAPLVTRARCEADYSVEIERHLAPAAPAAGRFAGLRHFCTEVLAAILLLDDLVSVARTKWAHRRGAKASARKRWEVLSGQLCRDGVPLPRPQGSSLVSSERAFGLWGGRAVTCGTGSADSNELGDR